MIDLGMYEPGEVIAGPNIITFEGDARSGKGTCVAAVADALREDGRSVYVIDQGQKFRALGLHALQEGVDLSVDAQLQEFLEAESTRVAMLALLGRVALMDEDEVKKKLYPDHVSEAAKRVAGHSLSHELAVSIMFDQVAEARDKGIDTVLIDGRAIEPYGREMHADKLGVYALGFYFQCDSFIAARRIRKDFRDVKEMPAEDRLALLATAAGVAERNGDDARRRTDPMVNADHAYNLNLLWWLPQDKDGNDEAVGVDHEELKLEDLDQIIETGVVSANTSYTRSIRQMTEPVVEVVRHILRNADHERASFHMLGRARRAVIELTRDT